MWHDFEMQARLCVSTKKPLHAMSCFVPTWWCHCTCQHRQDNIIHSCIIGQAQALLTSLKYYKFIAKVVCSLDVPCSLQEAALHNFLPLTDVCRVWHGWWRIWIWQPERPWLLLSSTFQPILVLFLKSAWEPVKYIWGFKVCSAI